MRIQRRRVEGVTKVLVPSRTKQLHFVHTAPGKKVGKEDNYMDLYSKKSNEQNGLYFRESEIL